MICTLCHGAVDLFIHPGEYQFADRQFCIRTTLGSCVAITLWHPQQRVGGMCHCMLPRRRRLPGQPLSGRYVDEALELLLIEARKLRTRPEQYEVKIFGGGNMFASRSRDGGNVATRNIVAVREVIAGHRLRIKSENVGGDGYRNVVFDIARGDVWVRRPHSGDASSQSARAS